MPLSHYRDLGKRRGEDSVSIVSDLSTVSGVRTASRLLQPSWSPETTGDEKYIFFASYFSRHLVGNTREINREMYADRFKPECTHLGFDRWQKS